MPHSYIHIESSHHQMRLLTLRFSLQAIQHSAVQLEVNRPQNWSALFRLVGALCIAALWRVKSLLRHRSDRPKLAEGHLTLRFHSRCFPAVLFDLILDVLPLIERAQSGALDARDIPVAPDRSSRQAPARARPLRMPTWHRRHAEMQLRNTGGLGSRGR